MTLTLNVNGNDFENFTRAYVKYSLDTLSGEFQFEAASDVPTSWPIKVGDEVVVLADGSPVLTGFAEQVEVNYDFESHSIIISGRSKTADVIDSTTDVITLIPPISLQAATEEILSKSGVSGISVKNEVDDLKDFEKGELVAGEPGQNVFDLIEQYCRKRQVLVTTNFDGDLLLVRNTGADSGQKIFNTVGNPDNNIKGANVFVDTTDRFNSYKVISQQNVSAMNFIGPFEPDVEEIVNQKGQAEDSAIRGSRKFVLVAENATDTEGSTERAKWEANIRRSKGTVYLATLEGNTIDGAPWEVNKLVQIQDDFCNINGTLLLDQVECWFNIDGGSTCQLRFVTSDAYTLEASEPTKQEKTNAFAGIFGNG